MLSHTKIADKQDSLRRIDTARASEDNGCELQSPVRTEKISYNIRWPLDFTFGIRTENGSVLSGIVFRKGAVSIVRGIPDNANAVISFRTDTAVRKLLGGTSTDQIYMILKNEARIDGSITYFDLFAFLLSLLIWKKQIAAMEKERNKARKSLLKKSPNARRDLSDELFSRSKSRLRCVQADRGVQYLEIPIFRITASVIFRVLKNFSTFTTL